jgi:release factor glutamine methyltransferase
MSTVAQALTRATAALHAAESSGQPQLEASILLAHVLARPRSYLYTWPDSELDAARETRFLELVQQRIAGHPVAYLTGQREFWSLDLKVTPDTLIPRPETELLVEQALALLPADQPLRIADLGTGSGAVALALASERKRWQVYASDYSLAALRVAAHNASQANTGGPLFFQGHWTDAIATHSLDALISNPPYVEDLDPHLDRGDLRFEPLSALVAGPDGLNDLKILIADAPRILKPGAWILLEHAAEQAQNIRIHLKNSGFITIHTTCDLAGLERVTAAKKPD